jgi:1-acyl-sn-glycerol-3-phosphate acyltransferase
MPQDAGRRTAATSRDADVIPLVKRDRCTKTVAGRPCRNYAVTGGMCRVCLPAEQRPERPAARQAEVKRPSGGIDLLEGFRDALGEESLSIIRDIAGFVRRRLTGDYHIDSFGFDVDLTEHVLLPMLRPMYRHYWRVSSDGAHHLPAAGGGLVVANHAGTIAADAIMARLDIFEQTGRHSRELAADLVFKTPIIGHLGRKTGATLASGEDADRLLQRGNIVAVWPEGYKGIGKPFKDRYKLQRFGRGGFVATALRNQVPIIPTAIVGSEEIYPLLFNAKMLARALGLPYFPVTAQMLALPVLGPLAFLPLPSKWSIQYGEPIDTSSYGPDAADDPMAVFELTDLVRNTIQQMLHRNLMGRRSVFW